MGETWYVEVQPYVYTRKNGTRVRVPKHFRYQPWHSRNAIHDVDMPWKDLQKIKWRPHGPLSEE